ncbi:MFS transporter [Paenibacillus mendelii]|uniref:MFS transporter n=1 Tax=Paenibacillus mendelii TaxID=206163 RepID=A0ABV6J8Q0_9BACL|nr:MFS transporter [Paenibacillus mendelii]MCQ6559510.1 MFS transporter [Paenibacillus mendelii]
MATGASTRAAAVQTGTVYAILFAISSVHMLNDTMQAIVTAMFPVVRTSLDLSLGQIGWVAFALNMTSSVMQPVVGFLSDKRPAPWMLPLGMVLSLIGVAGLAYSPGFWTLMLAVMFVGLGSAIFHPEGSRVVYFAAGGRRGLAQSIYQVGGNAGSSLAPLMTIFIFVPLGQSGAVWGTLLAAAAIIILLRVVPWYRTQLAVHGKPVKRPVKSAAGPADTSQVRRNVGFALFLLVLLVFARSWYTTGISTYYQIYLEDFRGYSLKAAQVPIFLFMAAGVLGTFLGGILADRFGRKRMILISIGGAAPFALLLPYLPSALIYPVIFILGVVLLSGFSVSVVYAQELLPGKVGMASGLITGLAFGMGAIGAVIIGEAGDIWGLDRVLTWSSFLPLIGLLAIALPPDRRD